MKNHNVNLNQKVKDALRELQKLIQRQYPKAHFEISHGDDPEGKYLIATVDVEDTTKVMDVVVDRLIEFQVDEGLPVYVIPVRPIKKVAEVKVKESYLSTGSRTLVTP